MRRAGGRVRRWEVGNETKKKRRRVAGLSSRQRGVFICRMAEGEGFEPPDASRHQRFSSEILLSTITTSCQFYSNNIR